MAGWKNFPRPDNVLPGYQYRLVPAIIEGTNHIYLHRESSVPRWGPYLPTETVRIGGKEAGDWVRFYLSLRLGEFEISQTDIVDVQLGTESEPAECRFERFDYPLSPPRAYKKYLDPKLSASFETYEGWADLEMTALAGQRDGKIVVAGNFTRVNGERRRQLVRITFEGRIDETFRNALASEAMVRFMRVQADGKIVVAGENLAGDGVRLVRLEPNGFLDASFQAAVAGGISGLAPMTSGDIVVAHETNLVRFAENGDVSPELGRLGLQCRTITWPEVAACFITRMGREWSTTLPFGPSSRMLAMEMARSRGSCHTNIRTKLGLSTGGLMSWLPGLFRCFRRLWIEWKHAWASVDMSRRDNSKAMG